jgi:hypothetical protein
MFCADHSRENTRSGTAEKIIYVGHSPNQRRVGR